jgi:tRNA pseudouridine38-40 synthase
LIQYHKLACRVEYDGTNYFGFQLQKDITTIQETIENALCFVADAPIKINGCGRTDKGVHATNFVFDFLTNKSYSSTSWIFGVNSNLPYDIKIKDIFVVEDDFDARSSALWRGYRYILYCSTTSSPLLHKKAYWVKQKLNIKQMQKGADYLIGEFDFNAFRSSQCQATHAVREIYNIDITQNKELIYIDIRANAFLHNMIRIITGCLLQVGLGNRPPEWLQKMLRLQKRDSFGVTLPAHGLYLVDVAYPKKYKIENSPCYPFL